MHSSCGDTYFVFVIVDPQSNTEIDVHSRYADPSDISTTIAPLIAYLHFTHEDQSQCRKRKPVSHHRSRTYDPIGTL
jgi:hypothetical protein